VGIEKKLDSSTLEEIKKEKDSLKINEVGIVVLETEAPVVVEKFSDIEELGRFVLESSDFLLGSGTISQPHI
jgi:translation elongation factor EF-1alpha